MPGAYFTQQWNGVGMALGALIRSTRTEGCVILRGRSVLVCAVSGLALMTFSFSAGADPVQPIGIPLKHVPSDDDATDFNSLGIMVGVNDAHPRLYQFDTGSDLFVGQFDEAMSDVQPLAGHKPDLYAYGDGSYGYWMQEIQFGSIAYYDPDAPDKPVAVIPGKHVAGRIIDWVYSQGSDGYKNHKVSATPIGYSDGVAYYADMEVRDRIIHDQPSDHPPFYGTFGAGNFTDDKTYISAPASQTKTGYVIAANANMGDSKTPGCAPCLSLHLTPQIRAQFTALMPWGKLDYEFSMRQFPGSGANASNVHDGNYRYTISVPVGKKKRAIDFRGPILFDTGTPEFIYVDSDGMLAKFRSKGYRLEKYGDDTVDIKFYGFDDKLNDLEYDDVDISRLSDEGSGNSLTIGLPFFQSNSMMFDLENRITAFTPYFVTASDFSTDAGVNIPHLGVVNGDVGSVGWVGLAGNLSGQGDFTIEKDSNVRMTAINTYTGATRIAKDGYLHLAGLGSIEKSAHVFNEGNLFIDQKGAYMTQWGVDKSFGDAVIRDISGGGDIVLGSRRLVVTAATGTIGGSITDYDDNGKNLGGGLVLAGGKLTIAGDNDYSGLTEVASGAEMHVTGQLAGDVSVHGKLSVDGQVSGTVTVHEGGELSGNGAISAVHRVSR
ncbi:hypothetical protein HYQ43_11690 [Paracoccus pantotrophus]|uniref:Autotransporter-associated beta strand repeat-containing protein n=1 Tax=Paracoccus pantotrophus TaxID=82367 RepID=A0A7H9BUX5_PARPN|nr:MULTISPECIES: hypothetical protein [Paracoccus]MDK8873301.1 hypothetical protein [Paracoccus sp. SSJ]QLH14923.1 hypothetical protein HYQ43_11690 [Paracoccus pantotrophus]